MATREHKLVLITRPTRLEELIKRFNSVAQAKFYIERMGEDFSQYQTEHSRYQQSLEIVKTAMADYPRKQFLDRQFVPNFMFHPTDIVIVLGQDGMVANVMKYLDGQPLVAINPDPDRIDGVLLPYRAEHLKSVLPKVMARRHNIKLVRMAQASLSDGQVLYAVNDFFIGPRSHTSARYEISHYQTTEVQSSSGVIVSTGLGSTAWIKSIMTGAYTLNKYRDDKLKPLNYKPLPWDSTQLIFAVREPFPSKTSQTDLVFGTISQGESLGLRSLMPEQGVIFSDGMEQDFVRFTSGISAKIALADKQGLLVDYR